MAEAVEARLGQSPSRLLADTNYATAEDIEALGGREENPIDVYAPPQPVKEGTKPENQARRKAKLAKEPAAVKDWRQRMETPEAAEKMKKRKRIELVNAQTKDRGLDYLPVRGLVKAKAIALWHALTHNLMPPAGCEAERASRNRTGSDRRHCANVRLIEVQIVPMAVSARPHEVRTHGYRRRTLLDAF